MADLGAGQRARVCNAAWGWEERPKAQPRCRPDSKISGTRKKPGVGCSDSLGARRLHSFPAISNGPLAGAHTQGGEGSPLQGDTQCWDPRLSGARGSPHTRLRSEGWKKGM